MSIGESKYTYYIGNTHYLWPCDEPDQPSPVGHKQCRSSNQSQDTVDLWEHKENWFEVTGIKKKKKKKAHVIKSAITDIF